MKKKFDPKTINPLASGKSQLIKFIHSDGKEHIFYTTINEMTNCRMTGFDKNPPSISEDNSEIKKIIKNIRKSAKIVSDEGDFY